MPAARFASSLCSFGAPNWAKRRASLPLADVSVGRLYGHRRQTHCQAWIEGGRRCDRGILLMALAPSITAIPTNLLSISTARETSNSYSGPPEFGHQFR
jgi:hypothetical protein